MVKKLPSYSRNRQTDGQTDRVQNVPINSYRISQYTSFVFESCNQATTTRRPLSLANSHLARFFLICVLHLFTSLFFFLAFVGKDSLFSRESWDRIEEEKKQEFLYSHSFWIFHLFQFN